jgi:hypothetical protein
VNLKLQIKILPAQNGWVIEHNGEGGEPILSVFKREGSEKKEIDCWIDALYHINELIGPTTNRYSKHRLHIGTKPGDKAE